MGMGDAMWREGGHTAANSGNDAGRYGYDPLGRNMDYAAVADAHAGIRHRDNYQTSYLKKDHGGSYPARTYDPVDGEFYG